MGVVPPEIPTWMTREELIEYRNWLIRKQKEMPFYGVGPVNLPSQDFGIAMLVLAPWVLSVIVKVLIGDWRVF